MFNTTVLLPSYAGDNAVVVSLVDGPTNHKTIRSGVWNGGKYDLMIGHSSSNENPGLITQRSVVRLALAKASALIAGKDAKAYAQLIMSAPLGAFTVAEYQDLCERLMGFMACQGELDSSPLAGCVPSTFNGSLARLYAGQP